MNSEHNIQLCIQCALPVATIMALWQLLNNNNNNNHNHNHNHDNNHDNNNHHDDDNDDDNDNGNNDNDNDNDNDNNNNNNNNVSSLFSRGINLLLVEDTPKINYTTWEHDIKSALFILSLHFKVTSSKQSAFYTRIYTSSTTKLCNCISCLPNCEYPFFMRCN